MVLSVSRRTDVPAFYGEWFVSRLRNGEVAVRNPVNPKQVTIVKFDRNSIDCIVFWTKNPKKFIKYLDEIDELGYAYYFQFTVTPYGKDVERNIDKSEIIEAFIELSEKIGKKKIIWRYDPILINEKYSAAFHIEQFERVAEKLHGYTDKCVISFVDTYVFLENDFIASGIYEPNNDQMEHIADALSGIANKYDKLQLAACCEKTGLEKYGIIHNRCIDAGLISEISGRGIPYKKDASQRKDCGCAASRDIGAYGTCLHGCVYCYASRGRKKDAKNAPPCDNSSIMLCDKITDGDTVKIIDLRNSRGGLSI